MVVFLVLTLIGTTARVFCPASFPLYVTQGHYNDPIIFLSALSCFLLFASFLIKRQGTAKVIRFFVPLSVAVFFIHANIFIEQWFKTLEFYSFINESAIRYMISLPMLALIIYIVCTLSEFGRERLFDTIGINKLIDRLSLSIDKHLVF
jgi:K+ transporter